MLSFNYTISIDYACIILNIHRMHLNDKIFALATNKLTIKYSRKYNANKIIPVSGARDKPMFTMTKKKTEAL